jgi:hypothetical protein
MKNSDKIKKNTINEVKAKEIQANFEERINKLDYSSKEAFIDSFPNAWTSHNDWEKHLKTRKKNQQIDLKKDKEDYIKKIFETITKSDIIIYERPKANAKRNWHKIIYNKNDDWLLFIGETGEIITCYKIDEAGIENILLKQTEIYDLIEVKNEKRNQFIKNIDKLSNWFNFI